MKILSGFFKFIAKLLMAVVVIGLPLVLLSRSIGSPLLSAEGLSQVFDSDMLASITESRIQNRQVQAGDSPADQFFYQSLQQMTHEEWVAFYNLTAPPEITTAIFQQVIGGVRGWIGGGTSVISVDLQPLKNNILANDTQVMQLVLSTLPACTADDLVQLTAFANGLTQVIPVCQPPEPFYSIMVKQGKSVFPAQLANIPDDYTISLGQPGENGAGLMRLIRLARSLNFIGRLGWFGLLVVYLIAIPLGARSLPDVFKWAGWPSLLAGVHALLLGLLLIISKGSVPSLVVRFFAAHLPVSALGVLSDFVSGLISEAARPMLFAAGGLIVWGVVVLIVGSVLSPKTTRAAA